MIKVNEQEVASAGFRDCREECLHQANSVRSSKTQRKLAGGKKSCQDGCQLGCVGQNPHSLNMQVFNFLTCLPRVRDAIRQQWAQERGGCRHCCPAARSGGRTTGAIASSLPTMLNVQKGQRFPAKYQLSGRVARLAGHSPCLHIIVAKPGDDQPPYGAHTCLPRPLCECLSTAAKGSNKRTKPTDKAILCPTCC